jgi:trans-aconitate methyltransferase
MPALGKGVYNLIIATEIFEHLPDPLQSLRTLTESLRPGGLLFDSMGGSFDRKPGGDHLAEALDIGKSESYQTFYRANYLPVGQANGMGFLFQNKG